MSTESLLLDVRPRKTICESHYVEQLHSSTRLLVADPEDLDVVMRYVNQFRHSLIEAENGREESIREYLKTPFTILATDCFEVCGLIAGRFVSKDELHQFDDQILEILPNNANECFQVELFHVNPDYRRSGLGTQLLKGLLMLALNFGFKYVSLLSIDPAIKHLAAKFKMQSKCYIPCSKIISNNNLQSKDQQIEVMMVELSEISQLLIETPPSLPNAYKLPILKRKSLGTYLPKRLGHELEYFVALPEDANVVKDFLLNEYFRQTAITRTLQCRKSDGLELITRFKPELLKLGTTFLAVDNGKICGLAINKLVKIEHPVVKLDERIPEDFTEEIDKQTLNHLGSKAIRALCAWMDSLTAQMLPKDCPGYYVLDMLTVHPTYRGCKIGYKLWIESLKHSKQLEYRYTQTICTAIASNNLATTFGMENKIEFPYSQLKYKGKKLFENGTVYDGGKRICMYIGDSEHLILNEE